MRNKILYYAYSILHNIAVIMLAGSVLQTFLLETGFSEEMTGTFASVMSIVQVVAIFFVSPLANKITKTKKWVGLSFLISLPVSIALAIIGFVRPGASGALVVTVYAMGIIYNLAYGLYSVLAYKLPYGIMDMKEYGRIISVTGAISGIVCLGITALISYLQKDFDYIDVMRLAYIITSVLLVAATVVSFLFDERPVPVKEGDKPVTKGLLAYKPFTALIIPNIARGFCMGVVAIAVTIGYYINCLDSVSASVLASITSGVSIFGCIVYSLISGKIKDGYVLLASSIAILVFLPIMVAFKSTLSFLIFYGIVYFFVVIVNYSVPVAVTKIVDYRMIGKYSGGRMLLTTFGTSLAGFVCIALFRLIGVLPTIIFTGVLQLVSGIGYYLCLRRVNK